MTQAWKELEGKVVDGDLRLSAYLGGSEHSAVFLIEQEGLKKSAVKLIPADPPAAELQLSRWKLAAQLSHPHLMRLSRVGQCRLGDTDFVFAVMEYADENLSQILPQRPLTPAEARQMLEPVVDAISYLHGQGFVHGHVKPSNIMAVNDQLRLSSDGLCPTEDAPAAAKKLGPYDPPEAASGVISAAGDVWSLGMTLVEVLTQRLPAWERTKRNDPPLPETLVQPFRDIAQNCLRRDPQHRWTVADIAARLRPAPTSIEPAAATPAREFVNWKYAAAVAGLLLAAMIGAKIISPHADPGKSTSSVLEQPPASPEASEVKPEARAGAKTKTKTAERAASAAPGISNHNSADVTSAQPPSEYHVDQSHAEPKTVSYPAHTGIVSQVLPEVPQSARRTITGTVKVNVRVQVDPQGNVSDAKLESAGPSKYFANLAVQAAQRWKFAPQPPDIPQEWMLRFGFKRTGESVNPVQVVPPASHR